jgi:hypothetical protein
MTKRILAGLSALLILGGAAGILAGVFEPWAQVTLFRNITLHVSGALFREGGFCLSAALLILLGMRRSAILCLLAACFILHWAGQARQEIPHEVKHQVIGAQLAMFPLNRLLDQFHINDVTVSDWSVPDSQLLASGLTVTVESAAILLLGAFLGLPSDPAALWVHGTLPTQCRNCGARWARRRGAAFCPNCGIATSPVSRCSTCGTERKPSDHFCITCGQDFLPSAA